MGLSGLWCWERRKGAGVCERGVVVSRTLESRVRRHMGTGQEGKERPGGTGRPCEAVLLLDCREWEGAWEVMVGVG